MARKCPSCNECLDFVWIKYKVYRWCWLCNKYYKLDNNTLIEVRLEDIENADDNDSGG